MTKPIIEVKNIGKRYRIGANKEPYLSLRDEIVKWLSPKARRARAEQSDFWALKDVSFSVEEGEAVGIIGRNGAGKSTLLKVLSQITSPSEGKIIMRGRVSSLLEVGTGFHPELTGRENIFLNSAILGMTRAETKRKFDEIIAFAEVEKFLDTPVKRYSSGMYVRLAFAVAAHLEPEILVVDEVLAVGDAEFQRKCLGKMSAAAKSGRTVLFVSHNMQAISGLCQRAVLLDKGSVVIDESAEVAISYYLNLGLTAEDSAEITWENTRTAPGDDLCRLSAIRLFSQDGKPSNDFQSSQMIIIQMDFFLNKLDPLFTIGFDLMTPDRSVVFRTYQNDVEMEHWPILKLGFNSLQCEIPANLLNTDTYAISPRIGLHNIRWIIHEDMVLRFDVNLTHGKSPHWRTLTRGSRPGAIAIIIPWRKT